MDHVFAFCFNLTDDDDDDDDDNDDDSFVSKS